MAVRLPIGEGSVGAPSRVRWRVALVIGALGALTGCRVEAPFVRHNPLDAGGVYEYRLAGPDSTHSRGELFQLSIISDPELPPEPIYMVWSVDLYIDEVTQVPRLVLNPVADGQFTTVEVTARYRHMYLRLQLDDIVVGHELEAGQKAAQIALSCSSLALPFDPCDDVPFPVGATIPLHTRMRDPLGSIVQEPGFALIRGSVTSRDPTVVSALPITNDAAGIVRVRAVAPGSTWIVVRMDDAIDSVRVAVAP